MLIPKSKLKLILSYAALVICAAIIFYLSSEGSEASTSRSDVIARALAGVGVAGGQADPLTFFVRKSAHTIAYFALGLLAFNAVRLHGLRLRYTALIAWSFVVLYAASDEFHQSFVPGRSAELRDVLIDSTAGLVAVGLYCLVAYVIECRSKKR